MRYLLSLFALLLLSQPAAAAAPRPLHIGMPEWCPYICTDEKNPGIMVEAVRDIFKENGIEATFEIYENWNRLLYDGKKGKIDAVLAVSPSEAPYLVYSPTPQSVIQTTFFIRNDSTWKYENLKSLDGQVLVVFDNVDYGSVQPYIDEHKNDRTRVEIATGETEEVIMHKIARNRGDIYMDDENVGLYMIKHEGLAGKMKLAPRTDTSEPLGLHLAFSPKLADGTRYTDILEAGTKKLIDSGKYKQIVKKYIE